MGKKRKGGSSKNNESVKVIVRVRPLNSKEKNNNSSFILDIAKNTGSIQINKPGNNNRGASKSFTYDAVFPP